MGDVLHALPAVAALRRRCPECFLGWVIEPRWAELLRASDEAVARSEAMPLVDRVHPAHARGWARAPFGAGTWREIRRLKQELRDGRYDLCIDLQGALRSAWIGRMARARLVGEAQPREPAARWFFDQRVSTRGVHVIEQALEVVEAAVGEPLAFEQPALPCDAATELWAKAVTSDGVPLAILNPGAGWGAKRWPAERYGAVARALDGDGFQVIVNAGPGELEIAQSIVRESGGTAQAMEMTVGQLITVTRRAELLIAGDTGPLHLACALGKPVVGIFGPTDPARNGPFGVPSRTLRHPESQRDHSRRGEPEAGLLTITVEDVMAAVHAVIGESRSAGKAGVHEG